MKAREFREGLTRTIQELGGRVLAVESGGRHMRMIYAHNDATHTEIFPCTPSDHRAFLNSRARIRRSLKGKRQ